MDNMFSVTRQFCWAFCSGADEKGMNFPSQYFFTYRTPKYPCRGCSLENWSQVMIVDYKLTYPSGTATAYLINGFHTPQGAELAK